MFAGSLLTAFTAVLAVVSASPANLEGRAAVCCHLSWYYAGNSQIIQDVSANLILYVPFNFGAPSVTIPVGSSDCINLNGGLTPFASTVSGATIPPGYICTFYQWVQYYIAALCVYWSNEGHSDALVPVKATLFSYRVVSVAPHTGTSGFTTLMTEQTLCSVLQSRWGNYCTRYTDIDSTKSYRFWVAILSQLGSKRSEYFMSLGINVICVSSFSSRNVYAHVRGRS
jgi:hypothetical protein